MRKSTSWRSPQLHHTPHETRAQIEPVTSVRTPKMMPTWTPSGAQSSASATPPPSSRIVASGSRLFRDHVLKGSPGQYRENGVVQREKAEIAGGIVGDRGSDTADEDGNRERQEEQWEEQLAGTRGDRHRGDERAHGTD